MKKLILSLAVIAMASGAFAGKKITKTASNGGPDGWKDITEEHTDHGNPGQVSDLKCADPGTSDCKWSVAPAHPHVDGGLSVNEIEVQILEMIAGGQLSGQVIIGDSPVTWNASDIYNYEMIIDYNE
jgi:hypothetical protein